jgi:hypothetical protein
MAKQRDADARRELESAISRRKFIQGAIAASAATGASAFATKTEAGALPVPTQASTRASAGGEEEGSFKILTPEQGFLLVAVLNRIIPATEGMPAAGEVGVANFIDEVLVDAPHLRRHIIWLLSELRLHGADTGLSDAELDERLQRMAKDQKESFDLLLQAAYTGYYSEPQVLAAIGWVASAESGTQPEPFDVKLLEDVRKRGPIYREA